MINPFSLKDSLNRLNAEVQNEAARFLSARKRLINVGDLARKLAGIKDPSIKKRARGIIAEQEARLNIHRGLESSTIGLMQAVASINSEMEKPFWKGLKKANIVLVLRSTRGREVIIGMAKRLSTLTIQGGGTLRRIRSHLKRVDVLEGRARALSNEAQGIGFKATLKSAGVGYTNIISGILGPLSRPLGIAAGVIGVVYLAPILLPRLAKAFKKNK